MVKSSGKPARRKASKASAKAGRAAVRAPEPASGRDSSEALVVTTLRLKPEIRRGLELLQEHLDVTMNKLMNDGLAMFVATRTASLETDLQKSLERITQYRKTDPGFSKAFEEIARAEVAHCDEDPVEGVAYREDAGPAVSMVRQLIEAGH